MCENNEKGLSAIIIGMTDTGEKIPAASGRISTQPGDAMEIFAKSQDKEKNAKLISKVTRSGHNSTIEHTVFNIAFKDVSVFVEQFMIEFRLASFTVKSRRYVDFSNSGYYTPEFKCKEDKQKYMETMDFMFSEYAAFVEAGIPKEDARFILPYCLHSNFFCTINARELLHVIQAMLFGRGREYKELVDIGNQLYAQIEELTPGICTDFFTRRPTKTDKVPLGFEFNNYYSVDDILDSDDEDVQLFALTSEPEKTVARSALISTRQYPAATVEKIVADEKNVDKIIDCVMSSSRPRVLESICCTFRINGVSLPTITHFARHRMQSLEVPSLTFAEMGNYRTPASIAQNESINKRYTDAFSKMRSLRDEFEKKGYTPEALVYCIQSGNTLDIVTTMNGRELLLFFKLRTCNRAQWEIREYAIDMLRILREKCPEIFNKFGPSCYVDRCPEGALSCGKAAEVSEFFKNL